MFDLGAIGRVLSQWLTRAFGCWHTEMSRPFTSRGETYRACLGCGARRRFDPISWEMVGHYYYDVTAASDLYEREKRARFEGTRRARPLRLAA